jgi:hypothetical protein
MKIALFVVLRPGWSVISPAVRGRIAQAREIADSLADAPAEQAEESAPDDDSAGNCIAIVSVLVRAKGRADTEPDSSPDHNVTGAALMHPRRLIASRRISMVRRKWRPWTAPAELSQGLSIVSLGRNGSDRNVLTPRC